MHAPRAAAVIAGVTAIAAVVSACGDSEPTTREAASSETATVVCGMLRRWNNDMADVINGTSDAITDADDPGTAPGMLRDGFDDLIRLAEDHRAEVDDLELPVSDERDRLLEELRGGADKAIAVLEEERADIEDLPPVAVSEQRGVLGTAFITLERAGSVVEPAIGRYDDEELKAAFAADDGCEHVIQPF
ncbi:MAG TPA: hypothetical protein VFG94_10105 [Acidimicrobiales bacterium]|jgi:hypothetical protein|nr:hypothetical protein [Acidimicrobiales bacterium]